jgi:hypothetical protein
LFWAIPVVLLNAVFLLWIVGALRITTRDLEAAGQSRKLGMYKMLLRTFVACMALVLLVTVMDLVAAAGALALAETVIAIRLSLWSVVYFVMLVAVTVIWRPGQQTAAFSVYAEAMDSEQMADDMEEAEEDDDGRGEDGSGDESGVRGSASASPVPGGDTRVETSADTADVDVELAVMGEGSAPADTPGRVTRPDDGLVAEARSPVV